MHRPLVAAAALIAIIAFDSTAEAQWQRHGWGQRWERPAFDPVGMRECESAFDGSVNEQRCMAALSRSRNRNPGALVLACERAFDGDANELLCVEALVHTRRDPTRLVDACERAFDGDANELACMQRRPMPAAVQACERAFDGDANELACLDAVRGSRYEPASLIAWCERSESGDARELMCIRRFR